ncbi:uncharacterized protein [Montipora foliosa]|uniref:uncharacterized protein n=1 Tax=Montipora foliosa TaxID=591990 RepID=UPI0035F1C825
MALVANRAKDTEMKARIRGVQSMMTTFNFYFGCTLGEQLLRQTDNLSRALQDSSTSAAQGNRLAQHVVKTLLKDRTDTSFNLFWARILQRKTTEIQTIEDPKLPRHEVGEQNTHHFPETHKDHYRRIYFNAIDTVTQCIATRFEQKDFKIYLNIQELLLKSFASEPCDTELAEVVKMYSEDLDSFKLKGQLLLLPQTAESMGFDTSEFDVNDLVTFLQSLDSSRRKLLSEISTLGKLLLVLPATNAVSERSFSALKWVKTYLRSTTGDSRLNHLMMLHVHKDRTDALTLVDVANDFVGEKENRKRLLSKFSANDIPNKFSDMYQEDGGDPEVANENRPVSLLPALSKICERVALNQFTEYATRRNCLSGHQSGNKKRHSTETLNILTSDLALEAMDRKQVTALVLLDLSKAFDSIDHMSLLKKLRAMGTSKEAIEWFRSYLTGRKQSVRIGCETSEPRLVSYGVPQGSILGPALFNIYINDLPSVPKVGSLECYVDDSQLYLSFPVSDTTLAVDQLTEDLRNIAAWCCNNSLLINPDKTKLLVLGTPQMLMKIPDDLSITLLSKIISSKSAKNLGVTMDCSVTYDEHVTQLKVAQSGFKNLEGMS